MNESENKHFSTPPDENTFVQSELRRSADALTIYAEQPGIGADRRQNAADRITEIGSIIHNNLDRVHQDASKSPHERTIHDPELAHLIALTIDPNMTALRGLNRRIRSGRTLYPWHKTALEKNLLGAALGKKLATDIYNYSPIDAGIHTVDQLKQAAVWSGHKDYKFVK